MNRLFKNTTAVLLAVMSALGFCSCSDDDPDAPGKSFPEKTYTETSGLVLTMGDAPMVGKAVRFVPGSKSSEGTLVMTGYFDLGLIPDVPSSLAREVPTAGVIPGDVKTELPVSLEADGNDAAKFSGRSENAYCTYSYTGRLTGNSLTLAIDNVELKDKSIVGKWIPDMFQATPTGEIEASPVYAVWESSAAIEFNGQQFPMDELLKILMVTPLVKNEVLGKNLTVPQAVNALLQGIEFRQDANVIAALAEAGPQGPVVVETPANMAQYVLPSSGELTFFLNPTAVLLAEKEKDAASRSDIPGASLDNILQNVMTQLVALMEGVPMHYDLQGSDLKVYLGTEVLLHLLKTDILPLIEDEEIVALVVQYISKDDTQLAAQIPALLNSAAEVINGTTRLEIGMAFHK